MERNCKRCHKKFTASLYNIKRGRGKFCSRSCYHLQQATKMKRCCSTCSSPFLVNPSAIKKGFGKYCSHKCAGVARSEKITIICKTCTKIFTVWASRLRRKAQYCSVDCKLKGTFNGELIKCCICNEEFYRIPSENYRIVCSRGCYLKYNVKENHWNWKNGATPLRLQIRNLKEYEDWRKTIMLRDNYTCKICCIIGGALQVDHFPLTFAEIFYTNKITSIEDALACEVFWDIKNGRTLCKPCHKLTPTYLNNKALKVVDLEESPDETSESLS